MIQEHQLPQMHIWSGSSCEFGLSVMQLKPSQMLPLLQTRQSADTEPAAPWLSGAAVTVSGWSHLHVGKRRFFLVEIERTFRVVASQ